MGCTLLSPTDITGIPATPPLRTPTDALQTPVHTPPGVAVIKRNPNLEGRIVSMVDRAWDGIGEEVGSKDVWVA